ncbi:hypothetical protein BLNAU_8945 [Blattamonas nauphoetae]|uniref:Uncharacterized protein n=1 Tax=Blattamonas nauphoetae TaxID=2049346 RepID=A0ABQ9XKM5_9EUKA|nr:hypothetical protein BLNAU_13664 [Blattamonas nauphoetae]KAK2956165.1 hypothetical protein BLNAU_8945 [Blattamonas nauphoetae]
MASNLNAMFDIKTEFVRFLAAWRDDDNDVLEKFKGFSAPGDLTPYANMLFHMVRIFSKHIDLAGRQDSSVWESLLPPEDQWRVEVPRFGEAVVQPHLHNTFRSLSPAPVTPRGITPEVFRNLDHHQAVIWPTDPQHPVEIGQGHPNPLMEGINDREARAEALTDTAHLLPEFQWEEGEENELKERMTSIPDVKFYPDTVSKLQSDKGKNHLNRSLHQLEADSFHLVKLGVVSFRKSDSVEELARSIELMTLKASEITKSINDVRITHLLALPAEEEGDAARKESEQRQEKRIEALIEKRDKARLQSQQIRSATRRFFRPGPDQGHQGLDPRQRQTRPFSNFQQQRQPHPRYPPSAQGPWSQGGSYGGARNTSSRRGHTPSNPPNRFQPHLQPRQGSQRRN